MKTICVLTTLQFEEDGDAAGFDFGAFGHAIGSVMEEVDGVSCSSTELLPNEVSTDLIDAAPELLAALKALSQIVVPDEDMDADDRAEFSAAFDRACVAIAQAEGR